MDSRFDLLNHPHSLTRPSGTLSPNEGEGWGEEVLRFMGSLDLLLWTRIGAMNRMALSFSRQRLGLRQSSAALATALAHWKSARGLAQSKTWRGFGRFMERGALLVFFTVALLGSSLNAADSPAPRWWKGNLHTHSLWSDGDDYPEMIVDWYKQHGYDFLALSDHNVLSAGERWSGIASNKGGQAAFDKYLKHFGAQWVEQREANGKREARLKPLSEFRKLFEEPGRFLLIQSEEITDRHLTAPVHINATNVRELIPPHGGSNVLEVMQNNVNAVLEQRQRTGQPMFPHLNHPNFGWGVTAEELMQVKGERFFEVYNGHPQVHNEGDATHAGTDKIWDILLTRRLTDLGLEPVFGLATDDAHNYHNQKPQSSRPGRGWVMVRAASLTPESLIAAIEAGEFYATSGVRLKEVRREKNRLALEIEPEAGVTYTTEFIGTRKGFDARNEPVRTKGGEALRVTHRYSKDVGAVLATVKGVSPGYQLKGDEIYVRARVTSSKPKVIPFPEGEVERAWTQPVVTGVK